MTVYKMTNLVNGMCYVGATTRPLKRRLWDHRSAALQGRTYPICQAIREFGIQSFKIEVLEEVESGSFEDLMLAEVRAIKEHQTLEPNGYNRTSGGVGTPDRRALESTRLKIGLKSKGRIQSEETRAKRSLAMIGKNKGPRPHLRGRPAYNKGIPHTEEARRKMSLAQRRPKEWKAKPLEFLDKIYPSLKAAALDTGYSEYQITTRIKEFGSEFGRYLQKENKQS